MNLDPLPLSAPFIHINKKKYEYSLTNLLTCGISGLNRNKDEITCPDGFPPSLIKGDNSSCFLFLFGVDSSLYFSLLFSLLFGDLDVCRSCDDVVTVFVRHLAFSSRLALIL